MKTAMNNFIIMNLFILLLCVSVQQAHAECYVTGKMRASVNEEKWFGFGGRVKGYTITSVIMNRVKYPVPEVFPYVDKVIKNSYGETVCILGARSLEFTGIADGDYEEVFIAPKEVSFLCTCRN